MSDGDKFAYEHVKLLEWDFVSASNFAENIKKNNKRTLPYEHKVDAMLAR